MISSCTFSRLNLFALAIKLLTLFTVEMKMWPDLISSSFTPLKLNPILRPGLQVAILVANFSSYVIKALVSAKIRTWGQGTP